jgi:hypothetical protein
MEKFKVLRTFNISTNDIPEVGERRPFTIVGDAGIKFFLQVKNEDNYYYNFVTKLFQVQQTTLEDTVNGTYSGEIVFPAVTDADSYEVFLFTDYVDSRHNTYNEVRREDGSLNVNLTTGSNSALLKRVIEQTLDKTLTFSVSSSREGFSGISTTADVVRLSKDALSKKRPFTITVTAAAASSFSVLRDPKASDIVTRITKTVGADPIVVAGEDIYPVATGIGKVNMGGGAESVRNLTLDEDVTTVAALGDRVTGAGIDASDIITVTELQTGEDVKVLTVSSEVSVEDEVELSFWNQRSHTWPITNASGGVSNVYNGFTVNDANAYFPVGTIVKEQITETISSSGTVDEVRRFERTKPAIEKTGDATVSTSASTRITTVTQAGNVSFSNGGLLDQKTRSISLEARDRNQIKKAIGYDIVVSDIELALTPVTTTTSSAVINNVTIPVTTRSGILNDISSVSGIGIDPTVEDPLITGGATGLGGAGSLTCATAQTLENGIELTFANSSSIITITGNIIVNEVGNESATISFDLDKILNYT